MRNLVLLLTSGHTVRIALRDGDLPNPSLHAVKRLLETLPAVGVYDGRAITFAYIEDPTLPTWNVDQGMFDHTNDFQRITTETPGAVISNGH